MEALGGASGGHGRIEERLILEPGVEALRLVLVLEVSRKSGSCPILAFDVHRVSPIAFRQFAKRDGRNAMRVKRQNRTLPKSEDEDENEDERFPPCTALTRTPRLRAKGPTPYRPWARMCLAPTGRHKPAQGKRRRSAALGSDQLKDRALKARHHCTDASAIIVPPLQGFCHF